MASIATHFSIFFLLFPFHLRARDIQFNKIPNNNNVVNKVQILQEQFNFMQETECGGYGLYGRESTTKNPPNPVEGEEIPNKKHHPKTATRFHTSPFPRTA
nr:protein E6-like [Ipomoea batatas]